MTTEAPQAGTQSDSETDRVRGRQVDLTIVLVSYNTAQLLPRLFRCIAAASNGVSVQTIVIDNASTDNSVAIIRAEYPWVELIANSANLGFGRANNQALPSSRGRYLLLLNTDAFIEPHTLTSTVRYMDVNTSVGILGVRLISEDGGLQPSCRYFPTPWNTFLQSTGLSSIFPGVQLVDDYSWDHNTPRLCDWVPGCFYLIRRQVIDQVGLFDSRYFLYFEEVDHCRAAKAAGWQVAYFPETSVIHIGGESAKSHGPLTAAAKQISSMQIESELLYYRKHHGTFGILALITLTVTDSVLKLLSSVLRHRTLSRAQPTLERLKKLTPLLFQTRLGARPTR